MKHIITGGPGVGKSTLIEALALEGLQVVPEAARAIILEEKAKAARVPCYTPILPQTHLAQFQYKVLERQYGNESQIAGIAFLDRSYIDVLAYTHLGGITLHPHATTLFEKSKYGYVFLLEPLPHYEQNDGVRYENREQAEQTHHAIEHAYRSQKFMVVDVPFFPGTKEKGIRQRLEFILDKVGL